MTQKDCFIKMFEVMWNECGMQKIIDLHSMMLLLY